MAINEQLIADLGEAINLSTEAQQRFGANNDSFNRIIKDGLSQINATIRDIDGMLEQIKNKITQLKARIKEIKDNGGPVIGDDFASLRQQLDAAQRGQIAATEVMNKALETLRANTVAMNRSIEVQDESAMTAQLKTITDSLQAIQLRLRGILNDSPGPPVLPGEAVPEGARGAADNYEMDNDPDFEEELGKIDGGRRRKSKTKSKTLKKSRRTKKKRRKLKGGYGYKTKQHKSMSDSSSSTGRGKGIFTKSKKRKIARS